MRLEPSIMNNISALEKETPENSLTLLYKHRHGKRTADNVTDYVTGSGILTLDLPISRTVRNKFLLFISHSGWGILL